VTFFAITVSEDGDVQVETFAPDDQETLADYAGMGFVSSIPGGAWDPQTAKARALIIKGEIVVPKPETRVTRWKV
jgi:hypothetical protein